MPFVKAGASRIVALGGGGFSDERNSPLDEFVLGLARGERPRICFVPTASGDSESYIVRFYRRFSALPCQPTHLELFRRTVVDLTQFACAQDVLYVGGGNVANMLAIWRVHCFDDALAAAAAHGTLLAGLSAGSLCWFEAGITDSFADPQLSPMQGLGLLAGSHCPHYDGEAARRPAYQRAIAAGMLAGYGVDDGVALHFADGELVEAVSARPQARAYRVERSADAVVETAIVPRVL